MSAMTISNDTMQARTAGQLREVQELQLHAAEANAEALRAAGVSARTAQADQAEATQSMQTSLLKCACSD